MKVENQPESGAALHSADRYKQTIARVGLLGSFSNSALQGRLQGLAERLDRLAASDAAPRATVCAYQRSQPGAVLRAVVQVLEQADRPLRPCDVHERITALPGQAVLYASVKSCLAEQIKGEQPRFERVGRGWYRVRAMA